MNIQGAFNIPFEEMKEYIAGKRAVLPTDTWRDIQQSAHSKAFVIAGVTKTEFLTDVLDILKVQSENGVSFSDFRKQFREKVAQHGWTNYNAELNGLGKLENSSRKYKAWRTQVIYNTNMRTAFAAGRWEQMNSETSAENFPYLVYRHNYYGISKEPRAEHLAYNGIVLPKNHSFWASHYPPNGFGCKCGVEQLTKREAQREFVKSGISSETFTGEYGFERAEKAVEKYAKSLKEDDAKLEKSGWAYNPGMDDTKGIKSLFEHIQKIGASDKYSDPQKQIAKECWARIGAESPVLFENSLALWNAKFYGNKGTKKGNKEIKRTAGIVSQKRMEEINKLYNERAGENLLENPIISISEADFEHSVRQTVGRTMPGKNDYKKISKALETGELKYAAGNRRAENSIAIIFDGVRIILDKLGKITSLYKVGE